MEVPVAHSCGLTPPISMSGFVCQCARTIHRGAGGRMENKITIYLFLKKILMD